MTPQDRMFFSGIWLIIVGLCASVGFVVVDYYLLELVLAAMAMTFIVFGILRVKESKSK